MIESVSPKLARAVQLESPRRRKPMALILLWLLGLPLGLILLLFLLGVGR